MKIIHVLIVAIFATCFYRCTDPVEDTPSLASHISIDKISAFIPQSYNDGSILIYKNLAGLERTLSLQRDDFVSEKHHGDHTYTTDEISMRLLDKESVTFSIEMVGSANYSSFHEEPQLGLVTMLNPFNPSGWTISVIGFSGDKPNPRKNDTFYTELNLGGKVFDDVFMSTGMENNKPFDHYSELYINRHQGVVAFRGMDNELWVLQSIE